MTPADGERRLAAIMYTDMVGYTALGQRNESLSLALVEEQRKLIRPILARHNGREVKTMGDAFLVEFPNALDAVRCAYDVQRATREFNVSLPVEKRIHLRVGLHLGDVVESQGDVSGDTVNVASRIEPLAEDGGVCLTHQVYEHVEGKFELPMTSLGPKALKNVRAPIEVYKVVLPWDEGQTAQSAKLDSRRIAILPFANMSPDPNDDYFADGITDEIITTVSGISGLKVISRTSVMGYKGTTKKLTEIGRELSVGSILEGSFKKAGSKIRVTTQLIDVAGDEHLWAQNYDRNLDDVFEVQSDVAKQVAEALRVRILSPELERIEKKPTESTAAYTLYLRGRSIWNKRGLEDMKKAMEYFEKSVKEDPAFALGYVGQADCASLLASNFDIDRKENIAKANAMLEKALRLDPELAEAHATLGFVCINEYDFRRAEQEFKKAIELKPSYATAHQWYAILLRIELRSDEGLKEAEKAVELDPLSGIIIANLGSGYSGRRDFSKASEKHRIAVELGHEGAHFGLSIDYGMMKMSDQMEKELEAWAKWAQYNYLGATTEANVWKAYFKGDKEAVRRLLPELESHMQDTIPPEAYGIACFYFFVGDNNTGFEWLERAYSKREFHLLGIQVDWDLDRVRTDPRYLDLLKRLGLD